VRWGTRLETQGNHVLFLSLDEMSVRFDGEFEHFLNFARQYYYIHFIALSFVMVIAT
jgi:hypothetical protein